GAQSTTASTAFVGRLDDFRLYNRALSGTEVSDLYNANAPTFIITASAAAHGSVTPSGAVTVNRSANQLFTFSPSAGYGILSMSVDSAPIVPVTGYTFINVIVNHTISATFAKLIGVNNKAALTDSNLVGRVVKVWGKVTPVNGTSFTISDGYNVTGVTVNVNGLALPAINKTVIVTGVLSSDKKVQAQTISVY
ncbi:MAG: hypothetical protein NT018_08730, partial [Armatimonadetes bacterium]|nr:hypothetical protein [Armatimonadota bacterium]